MPLVTVTRENIGSFLPSILEIERASFISPWSGEAFLQEVRNPASHLLGVLEEESLVGYICFWVVDREIHLLDIAVHPDRRGKGVARYMIREMIRIGCFRGVEQIWLEVRPSNRRAKRLYERIGFETVGRRIRYYRDTNEDAILMSLNLPAAQACPIQN